MKSNAIPVRAAAALKRVGTSLGGVWQASGWIYRPFCWGNGAQRGDLRMGWKRGRDGGWQVRRGGGVQY